jgi:hypothetical protein
MADPLLFKKKMGSAVNRISFKNRSTLRREVLLEMKVDREGSHLILDGSPPDEDLSK